MKATINGIEFEGTVQEMLELVNSPLVNRLQRPVDRSQRLGNTILPQPKLTSADKPKRKSRATGNPIGRPKGCLDKTKRKSKELIQNIAPELSKQHS